MGTIESTRAFVRVSAGTRAWERAEKKARLMDADAADPTPARVTVEAALGAFIAKKQGQRLSHSWLYKFSLMQRELVNFARGRGLTYIDELSDDELGLLSRSWKVAPITAQKRQERWHSFFAYCIRKRWVKHNPVEELGPIKVRPVPTDYFSREEFQKLVDVTYDTTHWTTNPGHRDRVRALLLLMRYSGLRLNDAVTLERARLTGNRLFLYQQKTGLPVYLPLPSHVVELLRKLQNINSRYFFWTGHGLHYRASNCWHASLQRLFKWGKLDKRAHPHMLRDTFAVELLLAGVPIDQVSILLGHASVKTTERHYAPFVKARQEQLVSSVEKSWQMQGVHLVEKHA
jgi:integrase